MSEGLQGILAKLSTEVAPQIINTLQEATEIRNNVVAGEDVNEDPVVLHNYLLHNRAQIERLENLTAHLVLLKSRTAQLTANKRAAYDDAYMKAATKPSVGFADYATAKEKDAHFNLETVDETIQLRKAESLHRDVDSAWDYCRILLRGAEQTQRDIELRIRLISLTSSLEK